MERAKNPFSPGAGSPPPELVGRTGVLEQAGVLLKRTKLKRSEKCLLLTGLRGVGKTVLLNEMEGMARDEGYKTILTEAHEEKSLAALVAPDFRRLLYDLNPAVGAGNKVRRGLAVLKGFLAGVKVSMWGVEVGVDIEAERGTADSGDIEIDLPNLFVAVAEAADERQASIALLIDEIQYLKRTELSALIMAMHKMQQRRLPLVLMGAGLPILPALAGESKSYAERLFDFPDIGALSKPDAAKAIEDPLQAAGVSIAGEALDRIFDLTMGYPYFLQEWGYQVWNHARSSPIDRAIVEAASPDVVRRLDGSFFRVRFDRLTPKEKEFLRAMAEIGPGPYRSSEVASILKVGLKATGPVRASLIKKGMIYSPSHGEMAFTVPLFDDFMRRSIPEFHPGN